MNPEELKPCNYCGRDVNVKRITLKSLFFDTINVLFNLEKGFLYTAKMLLVNPAEVVTSYLNSHSRYKYYNPFRYAFILITASVFLYIQGGIYEQAIVENGVEMNEEMHQIVESVKKYAHLISLLTVPFISIGTLIFYRKLNYAEHLVANFFLFGQSTIIGLVFFPFYLYIPSLSAHQQALSSITLLVYGIYFYKGIYNKNWLITSLKFIGSLTLGILFFTIASGLVAFGYQIITARFFP